MFSEISNVMKARMAFLESIDKKDRIDGTDRLKRLRQISPETGKFLAILASGCPEGEMIEIGTSAGYSSMWLSLAAKSRGIKLKTFEELADKVILAKETFRLSEVEQYVQIYEGDFIEHRESIGNIGFCFIDCEKEIYECCFDIVAGKMVPGGLIVADNATNHYEAIKPMINKALLDDRFDCVTVPLGQGEFICRRKRPV
jgi:caffeoyl-CoA O-methyltransferase